MPEQIVHLFRPGVLITDCCRRPAVDARIQHDAGTFDSRDVTCPGRDADPQTQNGDPK